MNVSTSVSYGSVPGFAAAAVVAAIMVSLQGSDPAVKPLTQAVAPGTTSLSFSDVPADSYTVTAEPIDADANVLTAAGYTPPTTTLVVTAPSTVTLTVPVGVSASQV